MYTSDVGGIFWDNNGAIIGKFIKEKRCQLNHKRWWNQNVWGYCKNVLMMKEISFHALISRKISSISSHKYVCKGKRRNYKKKHFLDDEHKVFIPSVWTAHAIGRKRNLLWFWIWGSFEQLLRTFRHWWK